MPKASPMKEAHSLLDQAAAAYKTAGGADDPQRAVQFAAAIARAHGVADETVHYITNVIPQEA